MADNPPSYDDAVNASAPPVEGGAADQAPYPTPSVPPASYPAPAAPQQPGYGPPPQQLGYNYNYTTQYPPPAQNYGAAYPHPSYQQQAAPAQVIHTNTPGHYNYNPVTVVSPQMGVVGGTAGPMVYGPAPPTNQLLAQQASRRRMCIVLSIVMSGIFVFIIIMVIIGTSSSA